MIGPINLDMKQTGERSAGNRPAAFDETGLGNVTMIVGLRANAKAMGSPPGPTVRAPVLDPTLWGGAGNGPDKRSTAPVLYPTESVSVTRIRAQ